MIEILAPDWVTDDNDARLVEWTKAIGDTVHAGDVIAEVETGKADGEVEAQADGILAERYVREGDMLAPGQVIGALSPA